MATAKQVRQKLKLFFSAREPFKFEFESVAALKQFERRQKKSKIREGMERYLTRIQELTNLYVPAPLRSSLPYHFHSPSRVFVAVVADGITIRYEPSTSGSNEVVVMGTPQTIAELVPRMSLGLIRVTEHEGAAAPPLPEGLTPPTFTLTAHNDKGEQVHALVDSAQFQMNFLMPSASKPSKTRLSPPDASLIRNQFELGIHGVELPNKSDLTNEGRSFVTRGKFSFPLYWDAIGIYPGADYKEWRKADFHSWAERHFYELAFRAASTEYSWLTSVSQSRLREHYRNVLSGLDELLQHDDVIEEQLQQFLSRHPEVLVPGFKRFIPKLALGPHVTDFVIEDATGQYLLVELENPSQPLFNKSGHASAKLTHAEGQVKDWIRYIQDNKSTVEKELGLIGISAQPSALVVIGRSNSLTPEHRRKLQVDPGKTEVITYDDLRARFVKTIENLLGMLGHVGQNMETAYIPNPPSIAQNQ